MDRKNGWRLAEHAGETTPDGMQRLMSTADWDPDLVRDELRAHVVEQLCDPGAVLVADESWTDDPARCRAVLIPEPVSLAAVRTSAEQLVTPGFVLARSRWCRRHQARARLGHYHRREQQLRLEY